MDPLEKFFSLTEQLVARENIVPPTMTVMGSFNTGKSTLINNLLHEQISPEDNLPQTSHLLYFKYGDRFTARTKEKGKTLYFPTRKQLRSFLKYNRPDRWRKIEITLHHPLLKKCTLVDTPGIDSRETLPGELLQPALEADKIIFLFHQRGIDELNKNFLMQIARSKKIGHRDISFWINCNLGKSDGTSLHNTRRVLRTIFNREPELYLINCRSAPSIEALRQYIQVIISRELVRKLNTEHQKIDEKIPARLHKSMLIQDDFLFLDNFWEIKKSAEKILLTRDIFNNLPPVESRIKNLLKKNQNVCLPPATEMPGTGRDHKHPISILKIIDEMFNLATRMIRDRRMNNIIPPRELGRWASSLNREEFKVVAVGGFSSGKSTFFNAIMGEHLLPAENRPTTTSITFIRHGPEKKAVITFKHRVNLKLCSYEKNNVVINQEALKALEEWLDQDTKLHRIIDMHMDNGRGMLQVTKASLRKEIKRTRKIFTAGLRNGNLDQRETGTLFRPIPAWKAKTLGPVWETTITFAPVPPVELDLTTPEGKKEYATLTTSTDALRIRDIQIYHPGRFFQLATFVDTPGLDSTHRHHTALTTDFLRQSDVYLFFLNGKHILNKNDSRALLEMFKLRLQDYLHNRSSHQRFSEMSKFFFIINFADTLTAQEKKSAENYLRNNLSAAPGKNGINSSRLQIFSISPLQALQGKDTGEFAALLNKIELCIWNYRGQDYFKTHLEKLRRRIETHTSPHFPDQHGAPMACSATITKFSAQNILAREIRAIKQDTKARFSSLYQQVAKFKQAGQFKHLARGNPSGGQVVTSIKDISYFRWINTLNRKIKHHTSDLQKTIYRTVDTWLHRHGMQADPYTLPPEITGINAAPAVEQIEQTISRSRNFYGGFKARKARQKLISILKEQEQQIYAQLDNWHLEMKKYIHSLITPGIARYMKKIHNQTGKQPRDGSNLSREQLRVIDNYMSEINKLEKIFNSPGGT